MRWITPPVGQKLLRCAAALVSPTYALPPPPTTLPAISPQVMDITIVSANRLEFTAAQRAGVSIAGQTYCLPSYSPYSVWVFYATSSQGWVPFNQLPVQAAGAWSLPSGLQPAIQYAAALIRIPYNVLPPSGSLPAVGGNVVALLISEPLFSFWITGVAALPDGVTLSGATDNVNTGTADQYHVAAFSLAADRSVTAAYTTQIKSDKTWQVRGMKAGAMYAAALVGQNFTYTPNPQYPKLPNPPLPSSTGRDVWEVKVLIPSLKLRE
jgi:hypothetical protein